MAGGRILCLLVLYVTMVYGPIAAMLVEMFPTRIRYTSMSLPYHIGNGWFGGFLPTTAFAMVAPPATSTTASGIRWSIAGDDLRGRPLFVPRNQGRRHLRPRSLSAANRNGEAGCASAGLFSFQSAKSAA